MKILSADEMRAVDKATMERGLPGIILMENAGAAVVSYLKSTFPSLPRDRVLILCGNGNNGGDGFVVARHLFQSGLCRQIHVVATGSGEGPKGDAALARQMLIASGCPIHQKLPDSSSRFTLIVDAVLGTGVRGAATGQGLEFIQWINRQPADVPRVSVDYPSGFPTDAVQPAGEYVRTGHTVTFTALKLSQAVSPSYEAMGRLQAFPIGTPPDLCETNSSYKRRLITATDIAGLFRRRRRNANKGSYGHVLVVGGSAGKTGAPAMSGLSVLRSGAGLVTVASAKDAIHTIAAIAPEIMTEPLPQTAEGFVANAALLRLQALLEKKTVFAIGPGLGTEAETVDLVRELYRTSAVPMVLDADALNALAGADLKTDKVRVLTPHPGEMSRLFQTSIPEIQANRLEVAESFAAKTGVILVLKGDRTVIAFPNGNTWVNPTGSPALATGGTGDILTGLIAGTIAQHPGNVELAVCAAVWLHGKAGELGAVVLGEQTLIATDLLKFLPPAMEELRVAIPDAE